MRRSVLVSLLLVLLATGSSAQSSPRMGWMWIVSPSGGVVRTGLLRPSEKKKLEGVPLGASCSISPEHLMREKTSVIAARRIECLSGSLEFSSLVTVDPVAGGIDHSTELAVRGDTGRVSISLGYVECGPKCPTDD